MKFLTPVFVVLAALSTSSAIGQTDQQKAFNEGKSYKGANTAIKAGVNESALVNVPGQNTATTNQLKGMYGGDLVGPGNDKAAACASYVPGSDAYKNQECETINFIVKNPSEHPVFTIDKKYDPLIVKSTTIRNTPQNYTTGTSGLSGNYTACKNKTNTLPGQNNTERCDIGREVTEDSCPIKLVVTYTWQLYTGQQGADLKYGKCPAGQVRGDKLTIPQTNSYETEISQCSETDTGSYVTIFYNDCAGGKTQHGYNGSACTIPPTPAVSDPPHEAIHACANAPRIAENCFTPDGNYTGKATVPVFVDTWDYSQCKELLDNGAIITN